MAAEVRLPVPIFRLGTLMIRNTALGLCLLALVAGVGTRASSEFGLFPATYASTEVSTMEKSRKADNPAAGKGVFARVTWRLAGYRQIPIGGGTRKASPVPLITSIGMDLFSGGDSISVGGRRCESVSFDISRIAARPYLAMRYGIEPELLSVSSNELIVIKTDCDLPGMREFMRLDARRLIVFIDGVFWLFEPDVLY